MTNTNYIQLVQVIVLLFIRLLWPLSTSDMRRRELPRADAAWCRGPDFSTIAVGAATIDNRDDYIKLYHFLKFLSVLTYLCLCRI